MCKKRKYTKLLFKIIEVVQFYGVKYVSYLGGWISLPRPGRIFMGYFRNT